MKDGFIDLVLDTGSVKYIKIDTVYANDEFRIFETNRGDEYKFGPSRKARGEIDGYFGAIVLNDDACITKYITREQAVEHRKRYSENSALGEREYGEKTVAKMLMKSARIARMVPLIELAAEKDESEPGAEFRNVTPEKTEKGFDAEAVAEKIAPAVEPKTAIGIPPKAEPKPETRPEPRNVTPNNEDLF